MRVRIADRHFRLRQPIRMRPEHDRPRFGRAIGVSDCGLRRRSVQRLHQALAHGRGAHAHELDAGEVGAREQVRLAEHHCDHRRHGGEPGRAVAAERLDIGARGELRQQHDGGVREAHEQAQRKRVHMIERGRDKVAMAREVLPAEPGLRNPDVAPVRQHNALRRAGRAGGVEEHCRLVGLRNDRVEGAGIEERVEAPAKIDTRKVCRTICAPLRITEHELGVGVAQDEMNCLLRKLEIHRHRDQARAHDPTIGREIFRAIGGEDRHAIPAREPALCQRARNSVRHRVELRVAELPWRRFATEIDDREFRQIAVTANEIAEIGGGGHTFSVSCPGRGAA